MPFETGNSHGNRFSSDNQPETSGRKPGVRNRSTIARQVLELSINLENATFDELKKSYPQLTENITGEELATLVQLNKAILFQDTAAYRALLDSAYGAPKQSVGGEGDDEAIKHEVTHRISPEDVETFSALFNKKY